MVLLHVLESYQGFVASEYGMTKGLVSNQDNSETRNSSFDTKLETVASKYGLLHNELYNAHSLTPLTPSFQCSE